MPAAPTPNLVNILNKLSVETRQASRSKYIDDTKSKIDEILLIESIVAFMLTFDDVELSQILFPNCEKKQKDQGNNFLTAFSELAVKRSNDDKNIYEKCLDACLKTFHMTQNQTTLNFMLVLLLKLLIFSKNGASDSKKQKLFNFTKFQNSAIVDTLTELLVAIFTKSMNEAYMLSFVVIESDLSGLPSEMLHLFSYFLLCVDEHRRFINILVNIPQIKNICEFKSKYQNSTFKSKLSNSLLEIDSLKIFYTLTSISESRRQEVTKPVFGFKFDLSASNSSILNDGVHDASTPAKNKYSSEKKISFTFNDASFPRCNFMLDEICNFKLLRFGNAD